MDDSPTFEQLALELLLSIAISSAVGLAFVLWVHPLAYVFLGVIVALVLLRRRLATPLAAPRWVSFAIVPIDTMLWPTAVVGDILRAHATEAAHREDGSPRKPVTYSTEETPDEDGPGSDSDQANQ